MKKLFFWTLVLLSTPLAAQEADPVPTPKPTKPAPKKEAGLDSKTRLILRTVSERYHELKDWRAEFRHESTNAALGTGTAGEGRFYFVRPRQFRYSITQPEISHVVSDGHQVWPMRYVDGKPSKPPEPMNASQLELDRYLLVLKGIDVSDQAAEAQLLKDFKISGRSDASELVLSLEPRKASEIARVDLHFPQTKPSSKDQHPAAPSKIVLTDALNNSTVLNIAKSYAIKEVQAEWFRPDPEWYGKKPAKKGR